MSGLGEKPNSGLFITLEGGEGGGKSTQARALKERLEKAGREVVLTREPGGTPEAEKIRALVVDRAGGDWSPMAETLLMFAGRAMHVRDLIEPSLKAGKMVICDRFTDSTRAYQGHAGGVSLGAIEELKTISIGALEPDLTFILDLPADVGLARSTKRNSHVKGTEDRMEKKGISYHEKLRDGYLAIAKSHAKRCHIIDATKDIDAVAADIWKIVETSFRRKPESN